MRINHLAVIVSVLLHQALGFLWYGVLFADAWVKGVGLDPATMDGSDPFPYIFDAICWLFASYGMAWLIARNDGFTLARGALLGAIVGVLFGIPALLPHYPFLGIKPIVMAIDGGNAIASFLLTGAIIGAWAPKKRTVSV